jgi:hypothetical protein
MVSQPLSVGSCVAGCTADCQPPTDLERIFHQDVVSGFSRTVSGPPEGGHHVQLKLPEYLAAGD